MGRVTVMTLCTGLVDFSRRKCESGGWTSDNQRDGTQHAELSEERSVKESGWEERQIPFLPVRPTLGVRLPSMRRWCSMINGRR